MGQNDSKQIQQNVALLELEKAIQHAQAQKFLHDYHTNDPAVEDVKNFDQNKLKMFLKYFILDKYAGRTLEKQNTKRPKTNHSLVPNEEHTYQNLAAMLCFEIYRIDQNISKIYQLITGFILSPNKQSFSEACKQILSLLGVKECSMMLLNKSNVQETKISFHQQKSHLAIKQKGLHQSPYPRSIKYRFRKLNKSELTKQKIIMDPEEVYSQTFYVEEIPTKERSSLLIMSFQDHPTIETFTQKADSKNLVEKYVSSIGQFLIQIASLNHFIPNPSNISSQTQSKSSSYVSSEETRFQIAQICWNFLKIYKTAFDFDHSILVEKIKKQYKPLLKPNATDVSFRQLKIQLIQKFKTEQGKEQKHEEIIGFLNQYEKRHLATRNQISEYLQKYFQAISNDLIEFQFDSNTELKVFVCSRQTKQNQSIFRTLRAIIQKGNTPTLLDIFKDLKAFRQFYKRSYQEALKEHDEQKTFGHEGVVLQFRFWQEAIQNIKISVSFDSLAEKYRKSVISSPINSRNATQKKKFTEFHNEDNVEDENKENSMRVIKNEEKEAEVFRTSIRTNSNKNLNILDLTAEVDCVKGEIDLYDPSLNILKIQQPFQFKLAYEIVQEMPFYKLRHPQFSQKLINFLEQLKEGYQQHNNAFHNFTHGVNVMHTAFSLTNIPNMNLFLTDFTKFTLVVSALCHDVCHTGFNNAFQIATGSYLAELFNDVSPLQNYHISRTLSILKTEECDFLDFLSTNQKIKFRKLLISNILNTDMKEHFNVLKRYEQKKNNFKKDDLEDEKVLCGMLIHSSDFGASTKEFEVCREWSRLVNEEFMNQSKKEAELGIPQSPFMLNLDNELVMAKNELGFLKFMVQPLYKSLSESFAGESISGMMLENVSKNIESWDNIVKALTV